MIGAMIKSNTPRNMSSYHRRHFSVGLVFVLIVIAFYSTSALAYHLPMYEWGVGMAGLDVPAYRGAKGHQSYGLPFPYVIYRGEYVRVDEEGMRGRLFNTDRVVLDISLAGNVPVPKDSTSARAGMPKLDPVGEVGPTLDFSLWHDGKRSLGKTSLWLKLPMRAAVSVGDPLIANQGWVFSPYLDFRYRRGASRSYWRVSLSVGPLYASRRYHEYFYKVADEYATATRPAYQPDAGYSGSRATVSLVVNSRHWFLGAFARFDRLEGAAFVNSPLVETRSYFATGFAVAWIFGASKERAPHYHIKNGHTKNEHAK
jgi:outer membrane protein